MAEWLGRQMRRARQGLRSALTVVGGGGAVERHVALLEERVRALEQRLYNRRWAAIEEMADYLVGAQVEGDYCEFGVFQGDTFAYACNVFAQSTYLGAMRCFAFDSFQGLPEPSGIDVSDGFASNFSRGQFACSREEFEGNLRSRGVEMARVGVVEGWFKDTLNDDAAARLGLGKVAAAWIDGDLYESTVPILAFLTPRISVGTILLFDDWRVFRNLPDRGEQRACQEWLEANPRLSLREIFSFGHHGAAFTVASC